MRSRGCPLSRPELSRFALAIIIVFALHAQFPVVMNRYDQAGTSANPREKTLNASNLDHAGFGKRRGTAGAGG